jgi:hypothetical protein
MISPGAFGPGENLREILRTLFEGTREIRINLLILIFHGLSPWKIIPSGLFDPRE